MPAPDDRIEELIAAAVAGELTPTEAEELDRLRPAHPWIDGEIADLRAVGGRLRAAEITWTQPAASDALRERIVSEIPRGGGVRRSPDGPTAVPSRRRSRRRWMTPLVAAACLVVGLGIGIGAPALLSLPPAGPPGTLGVIEPIEVRSEQGGVQVDAELVAHTWGTEAVLDATGLDAGATYSIVFLSVDGQEYSAGEMLGSQVPIHCRVNAALMREDAVRLEIRGADASLVATADLPEV